MGKKPAREITVYDSYDDFLADGGESAYGDGSVIINGKSYVVKNNNLHRITSEVGSRQFPISCVYFGSLGDSIADICTVNNASAQDCRKATITNTPVGISSEKFGAWLSIFSNGCLQPVFNGGIGGQKTTDIINRVNAAHSIAPGSKSLITAAVFGADVLIYSGSVNDFLNLTTASTSEDIALAINTAVANTKAAIKKARSVGLFVYFHSVLPFGLVVTDDQRVINTATDAYNEKMKSVIGSMRDYAEYYDARSFVKADDGGWRAEYCDALYTHPNHAACQVIYKELAHRIMDRFGLSKTSFGLPKSQNIFQNADLSVSSGGLAASITLPAPNGTVVPSIVNLNGINAQQVIWTPGNATGTDSTLNIDIELLAAGANPFVPLTANSILALEYDLDIDDGNGMSPSIYGLNSYLRKFAGATATIFNTYFSTYAGTITKQYLKPIKEKMTGGFIIVDEATSATSGKIGARLSLVSQVFGATVVVKISNIRCVIINPLY